LRLPGIFILLPLVITGGLVQDVRRNRDHHIAFPNSRTCTRMTLAHPVRMGQIVQPRAKSASGVAPGRHGLVKIGGNADLKWAWGYGARPSSTTTTGDKDQADCDKTIALLKNNPPSIRNKSSG